MWNKNDRRDGREHDSLNRCPPSGITLIGAGAFTVKLHKVKLRLYTYQACRAQIGSISVTMMFAPMPFSAAAQPFPT